MARQKKEHYAFSIRMDLNTHNRLLEFCEDSGQSQTAAVERAINLYIDDYEKKQALLSRLTEK